MTYLRRIGQTVPNKNDNSKPIKVGSKLHLGSTLNELRHTIRSTALLAACGQILCLVLIINDLANSDRKLAVLSTIDFAARIIFVVTIQLAVF